ncbi:MAG TPA: DivIVA domain-containing protein, partial [Acidimicrobiales bacterium]|nr:DivIVA domain-containing protein [Acidimicrobiales bacterium]
MADERHQPLGSTAALAADSVLRRGFSTAFRGFDQAEVRAFLEQVADELRDLARREENLRQELRAAQERAANPRLDEEAMTAALGQEAARVLHSAHEAAADIRRKAEENAGAVLRSAHEDAAGVRTAAESVLAERTAEAEQAAAEIRAAAQGESNGLVAKARREAEEMLAAARAEAESLMAAAEQSRATVLGDLMRRRRIVNAQVEQLGAAREVLLRSLSDVRRLFDDVGMSLERVEADAKAEAEVAYRRALARTPLPPEEMPAPAAPAALRARADEVPSEPGPDPEPDPDAARERGPEPEAPAPEPASAEVADRSGAAATDLPSVVTIIAGPVVDAPAPAAGRPGGAAEAPTDGPVSTGTAEP